MIWPFRQTSQPPETRLWTHLDACGIPFRAPLSEWATEMHLTSCGWCHGLDYCIPDAQASFVPCLDAPLRAQVSPDTNLDAPPDYLWGAVRGTGDLRLNYAKAIAALTKTFGNGAECSTATSVARRWDIGLARITCTVHPPQHLTGTPSPRHQMFPETVHEAQIAIYPAWRPVLSKRVAMECATAKSVWAMPTAQRPVRIAITGASHDWPTGITPLPVGLACSDAGALLVIKSPHIFDRYSDGRLRGIVLSRGADGARLYANVTVTTRDGPATARRAVAHDPSGPDKLDAVAKSLSARLNLPMDVETDA
ncbi:hypothetical protein [Litoreibacter albidus]|uniref:Uncharacterized protein n=1 Tax=Litoreibacter albidus TaxID=670155 RepID=A0A1H2YBD3_9RHOB|nr:hypothetical protein [Litoreibacter albidus]SDX02340.1 hypothetical protein SAMN04488001_2276 [Litoreibacter albidus]